MSAHLFADNPTDQLSPSQMRFEDERVRMVLEEFKLLGHLRDLNSDCYYRENSRRLTFLSFHKLFPKFPIILSARYRGRVAERCSPVKLFRRFDEVFLMPDYLEAYARFEAEAQGRPIGLVVPFDSYRGGMIVHNGNYGTRTTKMTHPIPDDVPPHRVTLEPFQTLIQHLVRGQWTPESPLSVTGDLNKSELSPDMLVTPWMVENLGKSSLIVLGWLRKILLSDCSYDRLHVRRLSKTERCVKAPQKEIAAATGLGQRLVRRGLEELVEKGLVLLVGKTTRSGLLLTPAALAGSDE